MDHMGGLALMCMIVAWIIVRPGRAAYHKISGKKPDKPISVVDKIFNSATDRILGGAPEETDVGTSIADDIRNFVGRIGRFIGGPGEDGPVETPGGAEPDDPKPVGTSDSTDVNTPPEAGAGPAGDRTPEAGNGEAVDPPAEPGGSPDGAEEIGGDNWDPWAEFEALIKETSTGEDPPRVVKATAERIWPTPPAVPAAAPPELPAPPPTALPGPSTGRSTTMSVVATPASNGPVADVPTVDDASPELTQKIGKQFDEAMTKAQRLLDQYLGALGNKREKIGGETTKQIAQLKQGLQIAQVAAAALARRGQVQTTAAEIVRAVDDVELPSDSYYGSTAR